MFGGFASALQLLYMLGSLTTIQSYICQPPTAPLIITPADGATVEAGKAFTVSGEGPYLSAIEITSNTTPLVSVQADDSNHFSAQITLNTEGEQTLTAKAVRSCGEAQGNSINVTVGPAMEVPVDPTNPTNPTTPENPTPTPETDTPSESGDNGSTNPSTPLPDPDSNSDDQGTSNGLLLTVYTPSNNSTTTDSSVLVNGITSAPSKLSVVVNGEQMAQTFVDSKTFGLAVPLTVGMNEITVSATSESGNASVKLNVTRQAEDQKIAWYQTEQGQNAIRIAAISLISILIIIVIIGIIFL